MEFYNQLAQSYDEMTRFDKRFKSEKKMLQGWINQYNFESAIDVACGTGLHTILLASAGIRTIGTDSSKEMLLVAKENAENAEVDVRWIQTTMEDMTTQITDSFDAVFCLGNSIPHLLTHDKLNKTIGNFVHLLNPGGRIILQLLNYDLILQRKERIIGINRSSNKEFIRFYDFLKDKIQFNILKIEDDENQFTHSLQSTLLYPYRQEELIQVFKKNGISDLQFYGDMRFSNFDMDISKNLVIEARKQ